MEKNRPRLTSYPRHYLGLIGALLSMMLIAPGIALAEKADRDKPINIEANRMQLDDINKVQRFDGNVVLTQGTLEIKTNSLIVKQDGDGFQTGTAQGGPGGLARFKQKRDGSDTYIEGQAEKIIHDARHEKTELFKKAWIRSGQDEVHGEYIAYDAVTEQYSASNSSQNNATGQTGAPTGRVKAIIQPKTKTATP